MVQASKRARAPFDMVRDFVVPLGRVVPFLHPHGMVEVIVGYPVLDMIQDYPWGSFPLVKRGTRQRAGPSTPTPVK